MNDVLFYIINFYLRFKYYLLKCWAMILIDNLKMKKDQKIKKDSKFETSKPANSGLKNS